VLRLRDDCLGRALLRQLARVHDEDRVGDLVEDREVVRDHDHALDEAAVAELEQHLGDGPLARDVERRGDLVRDQERRVEQGREDHHGPLLHPAGELERIHPQHRSRQPDEIEPALELRPDRGEGDASRLEQVPRDPADLARGIQRAHRVLRHDRDLLEAEGVHPAVVPDRQLPAVELHPPLDVAHAAVEADEALGERRLAAAGLAGEPHDLAVRDAERDPVERLAVALQGPVVHAQVLDRDGHRPTSSSAAG
jgi:hypothetical protein